MSSDPPMAPPNIEVRNLTKVYPDVNSAFRRARALFSTRQGRASSSPHRPALDQVSVTVPVGRTLGIIGLNGSGKSTLLQILAGVMQPTAGEVRVRAPLGALLELGAGFNPNCTGRENVITSAAIYGFSIKGMDTLMDEVTAFADIGDYFDQPLRTYSSGMRARLAFALTLQMKPRVLLVDEILSVGDLSFQTKCYRHFDALRSQGTSLVIVTHDLGAVRMLCDQAIALHQGKIRYQGDPIDVTESYTAFVQQRVRRKVLGPASPAPANPVIGDLRLMDSAQDVIDMPAPGQPVIFRATVTPPNLVEEPVANLVLRTLEGMIVYNYSTIQDGVRLPSLAAGRAAVLTIRATLNLAPGPYTAGVGLSTANGDEVVVIGGSPELSFEVTGGQVEHGVAHLGVAFHLEAAR